MIDLNHTVEEVNIIIHALAKLPYEAVKDLIEKIHGQAKPQVDALNAPPLQGPKAEPEPQASENDITH